MQHQRARCCEQHNRQPRDRGFPRFQYGGTLCGRAVSIARVCDNNDIADELMSSGSISPIVCKIVIKSEIFTEKIAIRKLPMT
jgi:hypothetical protein